MQLTNRGAVVLLTAGITALLGAALIGPTLTDDLRDPSCIVGGC